MKLVENNLLHWLFSLFWFDQKKKWKIITQQKGIFYSHNEYMQKGWVRIQKIILRRQ